MSAIVDTRNSSVEFDGIRRYKTRCKVRIDSHNAGSGQASNPIWITESVVGAQCSKQISNAGNCSLTLLPTNNWLNLIFPNDYVNVYFDIDDGQGWTRTFFGFVDRVEESYHVAPTGMPQTSYHVVCTDFQKAFEKTMIYYNPHMAGRDDFSGNEFSTGNVGGLALASKGVQVGGSPSDIVQNVILITLGFGSQFILPPSYNPANQNILRRRRAESVQGQFTEAARQALDRAGGTYELLRDQVTREAEGVADSVGGELVSSEERVQAVADHLGLSISDAESIAQSDELATVLADHRLRDLFQPNDSIRAQVAGDFTEGALNILEGSSSTANSALLDILDIFTFVERRAIDGFLSGAPVWQRQGSLMSILKDLSHSIMNEFFFDLRPLSQDSEGNFTDEPVQGLYARADDDVLGNRSETGGVQGITYVPAVVMREYPYATVDGLDLRNVHLDITTSDGPVSVGVLFFGAIFSHNVGVPGRHIVTIPNINWADRAVGGESTHLDAVKHLDVAVVHEQEITASQLGRSDSEHFNLFEFFAVTPIGEDMKYYMHDLLPIITPIHIQRHGLRVLSHTTRFANFSLSVAQRTHAAVPAEVVEEAEETEEAAEEAPIGEVAPGDVTAPCLASEGAVFRNAGLARWGYREKDYFPRSDTVAAGATTTTVPLSQGGAFAATLVGRFVKIGDARRRVASYTSSSITVTPALETAPTAGTSVRFIQGDGTAETWGMHQGIDIQAARGTPPNLIQGTARAFEIPVHCIADGEVVISWPDGLTNGYGNVIVVKHKFQGIEEPIYSVYAHLSRRTVGWGLGVTSGSVGDRVRFSARGAPAVPSEPTNEPIPIRKGDVLGNMGNTGFTTRGFGRTHLHFEIDRVFPPRFPGTSVPQPLSAIQGNNAPRVLISDSPDRPSPASGWTRSIDPVEFFQNVHGVDLQAAINESGPPDVSDDDIAEAVEPDDVEQAVPGADEDENRPREDVLQENNAEPLPDEEPTGQLYGAVDSPLSRTQVIRWALLQDHWYQHNLEYLSGRINMRPAPEIRVGYRLDIIERLMSFYVEGVNHAWTFPNPMTTTLTVTRGQPNNPYPLYVLPQLESFNPTDSQRRSSQGRLSTFFVTPDVLAVRRAVVLQGSSFQGTTIKNSLTALFDRGNATDAVSVNDQNVAEVFNEHVMPANSRNAASALNELEEPSEPAQQVSVSPIDNEYGINDAAFDGDAALDSILGES